MFLDLEEKIDFAYRMLDKQNTRFGGHCTTRVKVSTFELFMNS